MTIVVEGPDCVGKTWLARKYATSDLTYVHWGCHWALNREQYCVMHEAFLDMPGDCVLDRSLISEYVYAPFREDKCRGRVLLSDIDRMFRRLDVQVNFVKAEPDDLYKLAVKLDEPDFVLNNMSAICGEYNKLADMYRNCPGVRVVDNTEVIRRVLHDSNLGLRD